MRRPLPALLALALLLPACAGNRAEPAPLAATAVPCGDGGPSGYVVTGDPYDAQLRPLSLCPLFLGPPIPGARVSWLTGTGAAAVVATAEGTGITTDRLRAVSGGKLTDVPGLGSPVGHSPALARDGRLAYVQSEVTNGRRAYLLRVFDPATRRTATVHTTTQTLSSPAWGPAGQIAVLSGASGKGARLVVLDTPTAEPRTLAHVGISAVQVLWSSTGRLAVSHAAIGPERTPGRTDVLDGNGRTRATVETGWQSLAFLPDGSLLAAHHASGRVAALPAPAYDTPADYGTLPGADLWAAAL